MSSARAPVPARLQQAVSLHRQGQLARAREIYAEILVLQPGHFDALHLSGVIAIQSNDPGLALELIGKAIEAQPRSPAARCNRGSAHEALGQFDAALASFEQAIALDPKYLEAHFNRANVLQRLERPDAALAGYDRAIALKPDLAAAHFNRGRLLRRLQRRHEAIQSFDRAIRLQPDHAEAWLSRGLALKEMQQAEAALASYDRAIAIRPDYVEAHSNRGNVLKQLERWDAALASYDRAIALKADFAEAHFNRGVALQELGRHDDALSSYDRALAARPGYAEAHANRAHALTEFNRLPEAIDACDRAIAADPGYAPAHFNRAIALLLAGDLQRGWQEYEWRWKNEAGSVINEKRALRQPLWLGAESPAGKTVLLHGEQGLGDTIQFCRYVQSVADLKARVILEVKEPLVRLLSPLEGVAAVIPRGDDLPAHDYQCPLMSLPLAFGTTLQSIPSAPSYLHANAERVAHWQARLGRKERPRIGLAWSGNARQRNDQKRSIALEHLVTALPAGLQYVSLQREVRDSDKPALAANSGLVHFGEELDFENTAALCACLDLVISVDSSVAHLSAALGRPTWILLPFNPDWRWLLGRHDSPWYPTVTLYRQQRSGDWSPVFAQVAQDLIASFDSLSAQP